MIKLRHVEISHCKVVRVHRKYKVKIITIYLFTDRKLELCIHFHKKFNKPYILLYVDIIPVPNINISSRSLGILCFYIL